jgi:hypothetical protein
MALLQRAAGGCGRDERQPRLHDRQATDRGREEPEARDHRRPAPGPQGVRIVERANRGLTLAEVGRGMWLRIRTGPHVGGVGQLSELYKGIWT